MIEEIFQKGEKVVLDSDSLSCYITSDQGYKIRVLIHFHEYEKLKTIWYYIPLICYEFFTGKGTKNHNPSFKRGKLISKNEYFVKATELETDMMNYNL